MSEAWREVARLGRSGEAYPHVLADSHGWCLRLGPRERLDERYYSSLPSLLRGLTEQILRRLLGKDDDVRTLIKLRNEIGHHLREVAALGTELERQLSGAARQQREEGSIARPTALKQAERVPSPGIAAVVLESGSEAA